MFAVIFKKVKIKKPINLRSDVIRRTTERSGSSTFKHFVFTHSEVSDLNVTVTIQHDVVQFQISEVESVALITISMRQSSRNC